MDRTNYQPKEEIIKDNSLFRRLFRHVGPDLMILFFFSALLIPLVILYDIKITFLQSTIIFPSCFLLFFIILAVFRYGKRIDTEDIYGKRIFSRKITEMIRDWLPFIMLLFIYENLHDLTDTISPNIVDYALREIDEILFGIEPTLFLQQITTPWLTEFMTVSYALYFVYPAIILGVLYYKRDIIQFREFVFALTLCFYLGFLGYILVPAIGPRYYMTSEFMVPLKGIWLAESAAAAWNHFEVVKRDCFPSLHTAISLISLIYFWRYRNSWKHGKKLLIVCTPMIMTLVFSTIYLRYHWTIDLIAGALLAELCVLFTPAFIKWYYFKKLGEVYEVSIDVKYRTFLRNQ